MISLIGHLVNLIVLTLMCCALSNDLYCLFNSASGIQFSYAKIVCKSVCKHLQCNLREKMLR